MYTINDQITRLLNEQLNNGTITERKLCAGLCSRSLFRNMDLYVAMTDIRLVEMLIQRLGKSVNKLEIIAPKATLDIASKQIDYNMLIDKGMYVEAEHILEQYRDIAMSPNATNVEKMYYYRNQSVYDYYANNDYKEARNSIKQAINITIKGYFEKGLKNALVSSVEIENILTYIFLNLLSNDDHNSVRARKRLNEVSAYISEMVTDDEEKANIVPKLKYVSAKLYIKDKEYEKAVLECEEGLVYLRNFAIFQFMLPLLDIIIKYGENSTTVELYEDYCSFKEALSFFVDKYGFSEYKYDSFLINCIRCIYHYEAEVFAFQRKHMQATQQDIADKLMVEPGVISNYERGKNSPNRKSYMQLSDALAFDRGRCNTILIDADFNTMERLSEIKRLILYGDIKNANIKLRALKSKIDMNYDRNRIMIMTFEQMIERMGDNPDYDKIIKNNREELSKIYPFFEDGDVRAPFFDEITLLMQMANVLERQGKNDEAIEIVEKLIRTFENSYVNNYMMVRTCGLTYTNYYSKLYNLDDKYRSAVRTALEYKFISRSISNIESDVSSFAITIYNVDREQSRKVMIYSRDIAKMMNKSDNYKRAINNLKQYY